MPRPTSQDLAGFWDLLQLSIDDVTAKFDELQQIKSNQWHSVGSPEKKVKRLNCVPGQPTSPVPCNPTSYHLALLIRAEEYQLQYQNSTVERHTDNTHKLKV